LRCGLLNFLPGLASNHSLPELYLLSSWNYRHEPLYLAYQFNFSKALKIILLFAIVNRAIINTDI
jgi:hypothetical protein